MATYNTQPYAPPQNQDEFYGKLQQGQAVQQDPSKQWWHTGQNWSVRDASDASAPGGTGAASPIGPSAPATPQTIQGAYSQALQNLLTGPTPQQAGANVGTSAPVTGFNLGAQRAQERDRAMLAERAAAGGYSGSGGMEAGILGNAQRYGEARARFAGEQANTQEQGRRQELMQALALAQQMGDSNAARALQEKLGMGSLDLQNNQYKDQLGFNYASLQNSMNSDVLRTLFGGF